MKRCFLFGLVAVGLSGCGGSGGSSTPSGEGALKTVGPITVRGFSSSEPQLAATNGVLSYAFAGTFTDMVHRDTGNSVQDTLIASAKAGNSVWTYDTSLNDGIQVVAPGTLTGIREFQWSNDGRNLYFSAATGGLRNIYLVGTGAANTPTLVESGIEAFALNPNSTKILYSKANGAGSDVYQCNTSGSGDAFLKNFASTVNELNFIRDDMYGVRRGNGLYTYKIDGTSLGTLSGGTTMANYAFSRDGRYFTYTMDGLKIGVGEVSPSGSLNFANYFEPSGLTIVYGVTFSPDNKLLYASTDLGVLNLNIASGSSTLVRQELNSFVSYGDIGWQPFGATTNLVGASGRFGTAASAFVLSQKSDASGGGAFGSLVMMDAVTRTSTKVTTTPLSADAPYLSYTVTADNLSKLSYTTGRQLFLTSLFSAASGYSGVVVTIHGSSGRVASIVPFNKTTSYPTPVVAMEGDTLKITGDLRPFPNHTRTFTDPNIKLVQSSK